jgi:hypothetical protein
MRALKNGHASKILQFNIYQHYREGDYVRAAVGSAICEHNCMCS